MFTRVFSSVFVYTRRSVLSIVNIRTCPTHENHLEGHGAHHNLGTGEVEKQQWAEDVVQLVTESAVRGNKNIVYC